MDAAALSLRIDSSSVVSAANDLDKFSAAADRAGKSAGNQSGSISKLAASAQSMDAKLSTLISGIDKVNSSLSALATAGQKAATANDNVAKSVGNADSHVNAYRKHLEALAAANAAAASSTTAAAAASTRQAAANEAAAASSAAAAAAAGGQAAGNEAAAAAATAAAAAAARQAAANEAAAAAAAASAAANGAAGASMLGLAAIGAAGLAVLGLFVAVLATAALGAITFAGAFISLRESVGKGTDALGLNEKQLDRLKKKGIDTSVTLKDAFTGLGYAIGQALKDLEVYFKPLIDAAKKVWDEVVAYSTAALDTILKTTVGSLAAIIAVWSDIPNVIGDLFYQGVNKVIDGYNAIVQAGWDWLATIIAVFASIPAAMHDAWWKAIDYVVAALSSMSKGVKDNFLSIVAIWYNWPQILGQLFAEGADAAFKGIVWLFNKSVEALKALWNAGKALLTGDIGHITNPFAGSFTGAADKAAKAYDTAGSAYERFKAKFAADFRKGTLDAHNTRLTAAAGSAGSPRAAGQGGKTDAEKLADIYRNAQAEITVQENRLKAVGASARANAEMEERTKLLTQVEKAHIPVTAAVTAEVNRLSKAYADAKIAADTATAIQSVTDSLVKQRRTIEDQVSLIGLYGDALKRAKLEQEALNKARDALPRGEILSPEATAAIKTDAGKTADAQAAADKATRAEKLRKDAADAAYAMDLEAKGIGLTGQAAIAYAYATERLNAAKRDGITLSPDEIAAINSAADAYAKQRYAIDQQKQAIADAREVTKGFFSDWISGVRQGENIFKSFADSVVNALNKIIDKLLDKTLDNLVNGMFSGGSSGGGSGGGLFGGIFGSIFGGGKSSSGGMSGGGSDGPTFGGGSQGNPSGVLSFAALGAMYGTPNRFANGGAFTNSIVTSPTLFRFANGGQLGEMGEAGPEAIMPLKRGPNGSLGVQMHGGGKPSVRMGDVHLEIKLEGAISEGKVIAIAQQAGQAAVSAVRKDFANIAAEYESNGVVAA